MSTRNFSFFQLLVLFNLDRNNVITCHSVLSQQQYWRSSDQFFLSPDQNNWHVLCATGKAANIHRRSRTSLEYLTFDVTVNKLAIFAGVVQQGRRSVIGRLDCAPQHREKRLIERYLLGIKYYFVICL
jgi:hypothetical protein